MIARVQKARMQPVIVEVQVMSGGADDSRGVGDQLVIAGCRTQVIIVVQEIAGV